MGKDTSRDSEVLLFLNSLITCDNYVVFVVFWRLHLRMCPINKEVKKKKGGLKRKERPLDVPIILQGVWQDETKSLWDEIIKQTSADFISQCSELTARRHQDKYMKLNQMSVRCVDRSVCHHVTQMHVETDSK